MLIEKYMNETTYDWRKRANFEKDGVRWVVISEDSPASKEGNWYALGEDGEKVFTDNLETIYDKNGIIYNNKREKSL